MSIGTLLIFVLYPIASLMLIGTLCLWTEYNLYRAKQVAAQQLEEIFGVERVDDAKLETKSDILDYSSLN